MKILAVSDHELPALYSPSIRTRFGSVDLVIGCGDMAFSYLEYIISTLDKSLYYVNGNHQSQVEYTDSGEIRRPGGGTNLHGQVIRDHGTGLLLAGIEGSLYYNGGPCQYTQGEMREKVYRLVPRLWMNRLLYGRFLDILVTHAPPWKIHDQDDLPHQGIKAFNWLIKNFRPAYHLHGHVHLYRQDAERVALLGATKLVNVCGFQLLEF
jgi:Icc-related predicted phosphoesterase